MNVAVENSNWQLPRSNTLDHASSVRCTESGSTAESRRLLKFFILARLRGLKCNSGYSLPVPIVTVNHDGSAVMIL